MRVVSRKPSTFMFSSSIQETGVLAGWIETGEKLVWTWV